MPEPLEHLLAHAKSNFQFYCRDAKSNGGYQEAEPSVTAFNSIVEMPFMVSLMFLFSFYALDAMYSFTSSILRYPSCPGGPSGMGAPRTCYMGSSINGVIDISICTPIEGREIQYSRFR